MVKIIIIIVIVLIILSWAIYYFGFRTKSCNGVAHPGIGSPCRCDQGGDNSIKFYGDNWRARGAVCDGLYIPTGLNLGGQSPISVLEKMEDLYTANNSLKNNMPELAIAGLNKSF